MRRSGKGALGALALLAALACGGCASVEPWQKGNLAEYGMNPERDPLADVMTSHIRYSREAASGGGGVGGGGCGCN